MKKYILHTPDMSCQHCVMRITKILNEDGHKNFQVKLDSKTVEIETDKIDQVLQSLNLGGYPSTIVS